jgi:hypothetical protein
VVSNFDVDIVLTLKFRYIVWNATCGIGIGLYIVTFQPEALLPYTIIICRGVTAFIKVEFVVVVVTTFGSTLARVI